MSRADTCNLPSTSPWVLRVVVRSSFLSHVAVNVSVLPGNGDGTFAAATHFAVGSGPNSVTVGDFNGDGKPDLASENGWFRTGDVGSIDADGYVYITDRSKDVIKSGGEWISSIEIENIAMEEPLVELAACIAQADDKWGERPVLFVVPREGAELDEAHMLERYQDRVTRWSVPDKVIFIDQMPMTATGKIQKMALRKMLADQADPS